MIYRQCLCIELWYCIAFCRLSSKPCSNLAMVWPPAPLSSSYSLASHQRCTSDTVVGIMFGSSHTVLLHCDSIARCTWPSTKCLLSPVTCHLWGVTLQKRCCRFCNLASVFVLVASFDTRDHVSLPLFVGMFVVLLHFGIFHYMWKKKKQSVGKVLKFSAEGTKLADSCCNCVWRGPTSHQKGLNGSVVWLVYR